MKGYNSRNNRRRTNYSRVGTSASSSYSSYAQRGREAANRRRRRRNILIKRIALASIILALLLVILIAGVKNCGSDSGSGVVSGTSVSTAASTGNETASKVAASEVKKAPVQVPSAVPSGISEAIEKVKKIEQTAIATPVPTPRPKAVAITFDDGPSSENTPTILDVLEKNGAHATFFVVGQRIGPNTEIIKREVALGCEIGNHSFNHPDLGKMSLSALYKNIGKTTKLVKNCSGYKISFLRPPYGSISQAMREGLNQPMILWSLDTLDWKSRNAKAVIKEVKKAVQDGDIILMHDIHPSTAEAVKTIVPWLQEQGFDLLTVTELMERSGQKMENGHAYGRVLSTSQN